jgi:hypothetical protein
MDKRSQAKNEHEMMELLDRLEGINQIRGHRVSGGVILNLSHHVTDDEAISVFVPEGRVAFWDTIVTLDDEEFDSSLQRVLDGWAEPQAD